MVDQETFARIGEMFVEKYGGNSTEAAKFLMGTSDKLGGKSPFISNIGSGAAFVARKGDSESDLLAKLYILMTKDEEHQKKKRKLELKYQKEIVKIKERRIAELIAVLGGEYTSPKDSYKKKSRKGLGMIALGAAGLLFSPDVMAMFSGVEDQFDGFKKRIDGIGNDLKNITNITPDIDTFVSGVKDMFGGLIGTGPNETKYDPLISAIAQKEKVDPKLIKSVIKAESQFDAGAKSTKGAMGLMQLMPDTAKQYGVPSGKEYDPEENIKAGAKYLKYLLKLFNNDTQLAVAAYNAGEGNVQKYGRQIPPFKETKAYVSKVMGYYGKTTLSQTPATTPGVVSPGGYGSPVSKQTITPHGHLHDRRIYGGKFHHYHQGVDYAGKIGDDIYAAHSGTVVHVDDRENTRAGKYIVLQGSDGTETKYMHLNRVTVGEGTTVNRGQLIAELGDTGAAKGHPHLHFELRKNNILQDPEKMIPEGGVITSIPNMISDTTQQRDIATNILQTNIYVDDSQYYTVFDDDGLSDLPALLE
jgi:murein DD-endopeptidase MepM/ murein hydrolase activator NlpD